MEQLTESGIKVHCLAFGGVDLSSLAGKMTIQVISAVAEFERELVLERTYSGIARARDAGKCFGRPPILNEEQNPDLCAIGHGCLSRNFRIVNLLVMLSPLNNTEIP